MKEERPRAYNIMARPWQEIILVMILSFFLLSLVLTLITMIYYFRSSDLEKFILIILSIIIILTTLFGLSQRKRWSLYLINFLGILSFVFLLGIVFFNLDIYRLDALVFGMLKLFIVNIFFIYLAYTCLKDPFYNQK